MTFTMGCSVWSHKDWVGNFFPNGSKPSDFLRLYSQRFQNVEGNTTFYALPSAETVQKWRDETPESFTFCLKIPQQISHVGALADNINATHEFLKRVAPLASRLGPFFLQLPPHFALRHADQLAKWLAAWPQEYRISVEVRHRDWYKPAHEQRLIALLERHNAGHCVMDVRPLDLGFLPGADVDLDNARDHKPQLPLRPFVTSKLALVRYISHPNTIKNQALWDEWYNRIREWLHNGVDVHFFMHCPVETTSPENARIFYRQLCQHTTLPILPWDRLAVPEQVSLF
ncbi:MAG: DUF72 domain-containing protein [Chloroflexales bacterium]|nr:DUF72 domain-containing protein [Chloroflexales bacterium]